MVLFLRKLLENGFSKKEEAVGEKEGLIQETRCGRQQTFQELEKEGGHPGWRRGRRTTNGESLFIREYKQKINPKGPDGSLGGQGGAGRSI